MKRKVIGLLSLLLVAGVLLTTEVWTYGTPNETQNGGVVWRSKILPVCAGFEVWGTFGPFGGSYSDCDI